MVRLDIVSWRDGAKIIGAIGQKYIDVNKYLAEYRDRLAELTERWAPGEMPFGEQDKKDFIRLFGVILRLRNILTSFDEFADDDTLTPRNEQDYRSVYLDIRNEMRPEGGEAALINDDLVFEIELLKTVDIGIDYILMLVKKYHDDNCRDKLLIADIMSAISASYELRNKRDLIESFIDSINGSSDVDADWRKYIQEESEKELAAIIAEEKLKPEETVAFVQQSFRDGEVSESGTAIAGLMAAKTSRFAPQGDYSSKRQRIIDRLKAFFERFKGTGLF